jgi:HD-GYP domain-containing protein (c-di-GMP phosphodiesterase class II)
VCDAYDAMISDRPYRRAMSHADAVAELEREAGRQFDPDVVRAFVGLPRPESVARAAVPELPEPARTQSFIR